MLAENIGSGESQPYFAGGVDHRLLCRYNFRASCHTAEMVAGVAIVPRNGDGMRLADPLAFRRYNLGTGLPGVGVEETICRVALQRQDKLGVSRRVKVLSGEGQPPTRILARRGAVRRSPQPVACRKRDVEELDVLPALKGGDSLDWRRTSATEREDVACRVHITLMRDAAAGTSPRSYSQCSQSTRAGAGATGRASDTGKPFVAVNTGTSKPRGFVLQLASDEAPGGSNSNFGSQLVSSDDCRSRPRSIKSSK